ncbi:(Dimethylallyl)adenosine tRNA methylthiotransferase MiaB [Kiritimatiella glycovorans]|uniref:tRNA-2-methylthio-N(6)-dimethylallyladenosine synthase n=2 Tax=Kiritimatiella glycovorans TaxID=1307763 RepID=A0A0G3EB55_9BACT|nr:(Dimethylallyl)adenosine tRNA methylthiotransferase MiaB [Kiritimatiella glycovorans]
MPRTYHIWTIGCQMNEADSSRLASELERAGFRRAGRAEDADVVVLNTCVVRQKPEDKAINRLHTLKPWRRADADRTLALMGCLVGQREMAELRRAFPFVDVFMRPSEPAPLLDFLRDCRGGKDREMEDYRLPAGANGVTAYVPVTLGCSRACSYCVIPGRRGPDRSRPPEEVLDEVRALADEGVREIGMLGQIVDRYGMDLEGWTLARLLREAARTEGLRRLRFLTSHPAYLDDELIAAVRDEPKVCPCFELPFQAGSNRILKDMRRGYTREQYAEIVRRIRAAIPEAAVNTDIIVGYPTETEAEFVETLDLMRELELDMAHIAKYSPRPGTTAARMPDDVPPEEKERRRRAAEECARSILERRHAALIGEIVEVLAESYDRKHGRWRGRTPQGKLVFFAAENPGPGALVNVRLEWAGPYSMIGTPD